MASSTRSSASNAFKQGEAESISGVQVLGRYRLRIRLDARAGDFVARLTMPFFCPILPGTPISPAGIDAAGIGAVLHRGARPRSGASCWNGIPTTAVDRTANPDRIIWAIEPDAAERIRATERNENDLTPVFDYSDAVVKALEEKYGINRPGGQLRRPGHPLEPTCSRSTPWSPAFKGAGTAPLRKAINYVLDRPALTRAHSYLLGPAHRSPAPGGSEREPAHLPDPRAGSRHGPKVARARTSIGRRRSRSTPRTSRSASRTPRCSPRT